MKFSNVCDYKGVAHFIVKTGRKNIRILLPGQPYEKSFVVPLKKVSNRRPADVEEPDVDEPDELGEPESTEIQEILNNLSQVNEDQFIPQ
jgi:hypothetical protein